jgi:aminopeptidase N
VFDGIAYEKTAGVLRMLEAFAGPDLFRKGITSYLRRYAYSNAAGEDFWREMTRVTGRPIDLIMQGYVEQPGAPVVAIESRCAGTQSETTLEQERFIGVPGATVQSDQRWTIPVCLRTTNATAPRCEVLDQQHETFRASGCGTVVANADARGYYFTEYTPEAVSVLSRATATLRPVERIALLGDEWWMVRAGRHDIGVYLDLAAAHAGDETAAVVDMIASRLTDTSEDIVPAALRQGYQEWIRRRFGPVLQMLGLPGSASDSDERQSRRAELLTLVGATGGDTDVQRRARDMALQYVSNASSLPGTLAPAVLRVAALAGDEALYDQYLSRIRVLSAEPEEYYRFFNALSWFENPALVERTLRFAVSQEVRTQDTGQLIAGLISHAASRDAAWSFVKAQWPTLTQKLGTFQGIPGIIGSLGSFCSQDAADDVRQFFAKNPVPSSERTLQQALERIDTCTALATRQGPALQAWLGSSTR